MNITVRTNGIINNTLKEHEFIAIVEQIYGVDKTIDEYIKMYNEDPKAKKASIVVHKEVEEGQFA